METESGGFLWPNCFPETLISLAGFPVAPSRGYPSHHVVSSLLSCFSLSASITRSETEYRPAVANELMVRLNLSLESSKIHRKLIKSADKKADLSLESKSQNWGLMFNWK